MSCFENFNAENKLRIPLSAYAAQILSEDILAFSMKKTTMINTIILNYYPCAECSISLRLKEYKEELRVCLETPISLAKEELMEQILAGRRDMLSAKFCRRYPSDANWQISLNKKVKELLTEDRTTSEELYYGSKPGHFVRALLEEYAGLPHYRRERIVFHSLISVMNTAMECGYVLNILNNQGIRLQIKPYKIITDPLSMHHYLIGYNITPDDYVTDNAGRRFIPQVLSLRISRIIESEIVYYQDGHLTSDEIRQIEEELARKGSQFVSSATFSIKVRLSDQGIRKYENQIHLRPAYVRIDSEDAHIYYFECTEPQIIYYFFPFGKDAKILSPDYLRKKFQKDYQDAAEMYSDMESGLSFL